MYALNNLKGKDESEEHSAKYTTLATSPSSTDVSETASAKNQIKSNPPLWNTGEFYIYY
ncbi:10660_t:CDS:1, partial [Acaulospora morrowiae]